MGSSSGFSSSASSSTANSNQASSNQTNSGGVNSNWILATVLNVIQAGQTPITTKTNSKKRIRNKSGQGITRNAFAQKLSEEKENKRLKLAEKEQSKKEKEEAKKAREVEARKKLKKTNKKYGIVACFECLLSNSDDEENVDSWLECDLCLNNCCCEQYKFRIVRKRRYLVRFKY